jgi:hypothetical protein
MGLGFIAEPDAATREKLFEIIPPSDQWSAPLWINTPVDLPHGEGAGVSSLCQSLEGLTGGPVPLDPAENSVEYDQGC